MTDQTDPGRRLIRLLDHLGLPRVALCGRSAMDLAALLDAAPERVAAAIVQGGASRLDAFAPLGRRALWLLGDLGSAAQLRALLEASPNAVRWLPNHAEYMWTDTVAERTDEVRSALLEALAPVDTELPSVELSDAGEVDGLTYSAAGSGPPVLLLPLGLSAHQWQPLLSDLQTRYCTIVVGGPHLQPVATLEARARSGYSQVALNLLDLAEPGPGEQFLEVGCGSGAILRRIAAHPAQLRITGIDVNRFLLGEARAMIAQAGLNDRVVLDEGSAEALPYPDAAFDLVYSCTVLEEVDAERALAELVRVVRPGGRVAVGVRAVDRPQWTNLPMPPGVKRLVEESGSMAGKVERGCADESLYVRLKHVGLADVVGGPAWALARLDDPWWTTMAPQIRDLLSPADDQAWTRAVEHARMEALPIWLARPFHCAVGTRQ